MINIAAAVSAAPPDPGEDRANVGTTLKLRLSLLITAVLAMVTAIGGVYVVQKARNDVRVEARSTVALTSHLVDAQIDALRSQWESHAFSAPRFEMRQLQNIRHVSVKFYDAEGHLADSNDDPTRKKPSMPAWFADWIRRASPINGEQIRHITWQGVDEGHIVIGPDASYETEEMWEICSGLLELLLCFFVLVNAMVWWAASRAMRPVEKILQALAELRGGNLSARLPGFGLPELSRISVGFNHMAETLEFSVNENQRLTRQLLTTQETERTSLARELHDELGQCVSAIHADAVAIRNRGGESVRESAEAIVAVTTHIKQIVRSMLQRLRPPIVEGLGLTPALRDLVAAFEQRNAEVVCTLRISQEVSALEGEIGVSVYRMIQECLTNIAVHANARHADIDVTLIDESHAGAGRRVIRVTVKDDGVGFFLMSVNRGFGLTGIRERVKALGGACTIDANPGQGTRIAADIPLPPDGAATP